VVRRIFDDEESLMAAFTRGDELAFDQLFREYFASLSLFAFRLIGDGNAAEDIVQDCFVMLWERRRQLEHVAAVKSYLYTAIRYRSIDYLKRSKLTSGIGWEENLRPNEGGVDAEMIMAETAQLLYRILDELPARMQEVVRLYYLEEKSYREIGEILQTEPETVRNQRFKALAFLRKRFIPD
jgi:RNA polymerase sigma-70 factor (ECF subfamily)